MAVDNSLVEKSMRSVFVGNIPYEVTEKKLKEIFSQVGPVLSFRMMNDRATGKPKGYGFCEYRDPETALSAMRNLNGVELSGRQLRVDNACTEKSRMEMQTLMQGPASESPYGEEVDPPQAPEAISKAVASLPPEQMFELMKQMKLCIQNNPTEARTMLLQNPQLAYALLQAQVVMRIVDPQTAASMLHKSQPEPPVLKPADTPAGTAAPAISAAPAPAVPAAPVPAPVVSVAAPQPAVKEGPFGPIGGGQDVDFRQGPTALAGAPAGDMDMRSLDPRAGGRLADQDLRMPPRGPDMGRGGPPPGGLRGDMDLRSGDRDMRGPPPPPQDFDARAFGRDPRAAGAPFGRGFPEAPAPSRDPRDPRDPREARDPRDPRAAAGPIPGPMAGPLAGGDRDMRGPPPAAPSRPGPDLGAINLPANLAGGDQEKAALIMQVLQLSDEQIAMLPPEQRQSIMVLKEQISKSAR
ncbi:cleavage stimulation factor subunit 2-like [Amphibalanus amphitrite]|uniref:cleavage stimulation factor subunit 2-like n=1 Tax=Amphibalanus amphitrite TaxID=1232801 RepID=UPI001C9296FD|nr:cleavage stimulation factor subunit 2-like [Amphibalanus amphitrite]XP_043192923.1 cleavage stimulation factor subunit 2-like [Amphibalanus amphitrite]